jgi:hypothetical protein
MSVRMLVAAHKRADMPRDPLYLPVRVGHALSSDDFGYQRDDVGPNISNLNRSYCELTAVYWAWKNLSADAYGLSHYRRYFIGSSAGPNGSSVLSASEASALMASHDVVLARRRRYVVESVESHYRHAHHGSDLDVLAGVLEDLSPDFLPAYRRVLGRRSLSLYNMFLMRSDVFEEYASWLFPVLEAASARIENDSRTVFQQRTMGYLGERLLNVWVAGRPELRVEHRKIVNVEGDPVVTKVAGLLARKFGFVTPSERQS